MNRRVRYGLGTAAVVGALAASYYAIPIGLAIISLGEICLYSGRRLLRRVRRDSVRRLLTSNARRHPRVREMRTGEGRPASRGTHSSNPPTLGPVIIGIAALVLVLAGCGRGVDGYVKEYEGGDVEVKSCQQIGETITPAGTYPDEAEDGDSEDEVWKCAIGEQNVTSGRSVSRCYVVHESKVRTIVRGVECS
jgi:hypothetical protein